MCNRILLINQGQVVLYGPLSEIKAKHAEHAVLLECDELPEGLSGVQRVEVLNHAKRLILDQEVSAQDILRQLVEAGISVQRFEEATPPLEDIFISVVESDR
jgi:ABC-2 type transport system ATP-binding protein